MSSTTSTDRIEKTATLAAPRSRVWRALTDAGEFGAWFGVRLEGPLTKGSAVPGRFTHPGYEHLTFHIRVEAIDPQRYFAFRWQPSASDPGIDDSHEPGRLVEFTLDEQGEGTVLTIVESGFDRIPLEHRAEALRLNDHGWTQQIRNIGRHVAQP